MASLPPMSGGDSASQELLIASFMRNRRVELYLPFIIGVWLDALCLGLLVVTFGSWLTTVRQTDRPLVRYLVFYLMGLSTLMSGFMMAHWFVVYILAWGQFTKLFDTTILRVVPTFFVVTRVPAAFFFAVRAYNVLKQPKWLPCVLAPLFLTCLVSGFIGTAFFTSIPARQLVLNCILIYASTEVASDVIITSSIFYGLWKSKTGWAHTDKVISHLMLLVETQTPPAIFAIAFLIVSIYKGDGTALGYFVFMPKIHVLCMMLGVNSRVSVAKRMNSSAAPYVRTPSILGLCFRI